MQREQHFSQTWEKKKAGKFSVLFSWLTDAANYLAGTFKTPEKTAVIY